MASLLNTTKATDAWTKIGSDPAVIIWNNHPTLALRVTIADALPAADDKAFHLLLPNSSLEHAQIPEGSAVYVRTDRYEAEAMVVWRQLQN